MQSGCTTDVNIGRVAVFMVFVLGLTHVDGPYLQAWLSSDFFESLLIVIAHHSAQLEHKQK